MKTAMLSLLLLSLFLVACGDAGGGGGDEPAADTGKAVKAAAIADAIAANPADIEAILAKHGMTREEFLALIDEITEDEELTNAFDAARKVQTPE